MDSRNQLLVFALKKVQHSIKAWLPTPVRRIIKRYVGARIRPVGYKGGALPFVQDRVAVWGFLRSEIGLGRAARTTIAAIRAVEVDCVAHAFNLADRDNIPFDLDPITAKSAANV